MNLSNLGELPEHVKKELAFYLEGFEYVCGRTLDSESFTFYQLALVNDMGYSIRFVNVCDAKGSAYCKVETVDFDDNNMRLALSALWQKQAEVREHMLSAIRTNDNPQEEIA